MSAWTETELNVLNAADELELTALRKDGTLRKPVIIWMVRIADEIYVRSVNGRSSAWFRGVAVMHEGRVSAGGISKEVAFVEVNEAALQTQISAAYRAKYHRYPVAYVDHVTGPGALSATLKLVPK